MTIRQPSPASPAPSLHADAPTTRFSDRAGDYARHRPSYPSRAIDAILDGLGPAATITAADIGAGTGISSRLLADRGVTVFAIEPNALMRQAAEPHPRIRWIDAKAEQTTLPDSSVNLLLCAQAFHWFRHDQALREFRRILRPGGEGRLALMWNSRDTTDPLTRLYSQAVTQASGSHPAADLELDPRAIVEASGLPKPTLSKFPYAQELDLPGLIGRALSASYVPKSGPAHDRLRADLKAACDRHADPSGMVQLHYSTDVYTTHTMP